MGDEVFVYTGVFDTVEATTRMEMVIAEQLRNNWKIEGFAIAEPKRFAIIFSRINLFKGLAIYDIIGDKKT